MDYNITDETLAVVHLVWLPAGIEQFHEFIGSYRAYPAGCDHELIILYNGVSSEAQAGAYEQYLAELGVAHRSYYLSSGQDIEAYYWISGLLEHRYVLFLNSYSRLLTGNWGKYFLDAIRGDRVGAVSATGSWQSYSSTFFMKERIGWAYEAGEPTPFQKIKLFAKNIFYWSVLFKPFPNPHLRTNAFIIRRELFLSISRPAAFRNKFTAYVYESGRRGFSGQLIRRGYKILVVDRFGRVFAGEEWKGRSIFWAGSQEDLLVSDNQTRSYNEAVPAEKWKFTYLAWGK